MKDYAKRFYGSNDWHSCRDSFIAERLNIDGGLCQRCHDSLGYIVHHKIELTPSNITDANISLNHSNLEYVCHECHNKIHDVWQPRSRTYFDEDGNILPRSQNDINM